MRSYKALLNDAVNAFGLRKLTALETEALKNCLLDMYDQIKQICEDNNLCLMLIGGSCLGAVRHKGFIPWDDDLDLVMPRPDYDKFVALLEKGVMGDFYDYVYPNSYKDSPILWLQIYHKNTRLISVEGERPKYPNGCYIDVFPIDGVPANNLKRRTKGYLANCLRLIANMVVDFEQPMTSSLKAFYASNKDLQRMMFVRRGLGRIFSIISHKTWANLYDRFVRNPNMSGWVGIPTGRGLYYNESHPASVFFPPAEGEFEGREVLLPANCDAYLKALYGDYMWIPPKEKRESHFIKELELPEKYYSKDVDR